MAEFKEFQEHSTQPEDLKKNPPKKRIYFLLLAIAGAVVLIFGSEILISSGKKIALYFGVSNLVIGLTLVAIGTSLPEMATTIIAAARRETDLIIGNVVGSNIFNLLLIGGIVPLIKPIPIDANLFKIQFPILIILSILILPMMRIELNLQRYEGAILLIIYLLFMYFTF
jgi:cation:H+ antiporter